MSYLDLPKANKSKIPSYCSLKFDKHHEKLLDDIKPETNIIYDLFSSRPLRFLMGGGGGPVVVVVAPTPSLSLCSLIPPLMMYPVIHPN